ncbi:hypothetical protein [Actinomadura nitritigenes]|uniref:hypothetical protein n=1 Tax=Actinomadura nitritigenes TaxID=134602 RepID=UPI003D8F0223
MGNTNAWTVLRTTDLNQALNLACRLLSVTPWYDPTGCFLDAWVNTDSDLERLVTAFPDAQTCSYGADGSLWPMNVSVGLESFEQAADAFRPGMAITRCYILWHNLKWPAVAELDLDEEYKYAELQVACNSHDIYCEKPATEHTVFIHSRPGDQQRVEWLADRAGTTIYGPP